MAAERLTFFPGAMALVVALLVDVVNTHYGITNEFEVELAEPLKMTWDWSPAAAHMFQQDARSWSPCNFTHEPNEFFKCDMKHLVSSVMEFPTMLGEHFMLEPSSEINGNTCPMTCNSTWIGTTVVQVGELSEPFGDWNPGQMLKERIGTFLVMSGLRFLLVASLHESLQELFFHGICTFGFILCFFLTHVYVLDLLQSFDNMQFPSISLHVQRFGGEMFEEETCEV